jgi:protease-4
MRLHVLPALMILAAIGLAATPAPAAPKEPAKDRAATSRTADAAGAVIPVFSLRGPIIESESDDGLRLGPQPLALRDLIERMDKASADPAVKAVVFVAEDAHAGPGQIAELRQSMKKLRDAGKGVFVHSDSMDIGDYTLFSGATRLSVVPTADLWVNGIHGETPYLRGLLDKIGVKPDFLTCGAYKSAAEMFMRDGPSPAADEMMNWLFDGLYDSITKMIADGRGVSAEKVKQWIDEAPYTAEKAKAVGLIDAVEYRQDFEKMLKDKYGSSATFNRKYGEKEQPQLDFSSPFAIMKIWGELLAGPQKQPTGKDAVAVVYVDGMISPGSGEGSIFGGAGAHSTPIRRALDEARRDPSIKAVVLRVDSPGGSATASEIIFDATRRVKAVKPFCVSMGNVAGSGGYYVACAADTIFAEDGTLTGSIGVVGGKLATHDMWSKIGVTFKPYQRGKNAMLLSTAQVFTPAEREKVQSWMNDVYDVFKQHVVEVRGKKLTKPIDDIAGGRVYTGRQALALGLVDRIGSLEDAIGHVAQQAGLKDYDVRILPEPKNFLEKLMESSSGAGDDPKWLAQRGLPAESLADLAMPYLRHMDPQRIGAIRAALQRLDLMRGESVLLSMPEISIWN